MVYGSVLVAGYVAQDRLLATVIVADSFAGWNFAIKDPKVHSSIS
jgi:hypothetical protein